MELSNVTIRAIIFDLYGTLLEVGPPPIDAEANWQRLFQDLFQTEPRLSRLDFSVACSRVIARHHEVARARGIDWPEIDWASVVAEVLPDLTRLPERDREAFFLRHIRTGHTTRLTAATATALREFKARSLWLGIVSNAQAYTRRELEEALAGHGLTTSLFESDLCFWSYEYGFSKPDPHVFQILTTRLQARGIRPDETLMVGDRPDNDVQPARAFGWQTWQWGPAGDGDWLALARQLQP
jgi:putative hydrolase of the HAD superfamily